MALYGELVCVKCQKVLSYPLGSISCRCQGCRTVNPAQHMSFDCPTCHRELLLPVNTIEALCPCCTTVIAIPLELLPPVPPLALDDGQGESAPMACMYVQSSTGQTSVATKIV